MIELSAGFPANLAYFKLDFLDKDRVELGVAFREVLPMLWLKAGAKGQRPDLAPGALPEWFVPEDSNFAVLLAEARVKSFVAALRGRTGISKVFVVTDAEEAFRTLSDEVQTAIGAANPQLELVQLYRDYLVNFMINARVDSDQRSSAGAA